MTRGQLDRGAEAELELATAIARRRQAEAGSWHDALLGVMVAAPLLAPAIAAIRFVRELL